MTGPRAARSAIYSAGLPACQGPWTPGRDYAAGGGEGRRRGRGRNGTLGSFGGVFTPSVLTILGVILFLRTGFVVGSAGLGRALLILACCSPT